MFFFFARSLALIPCRIRYRTDLLY